MCINLFDHFDTHLRNQRNEVCDSTTKYIILFKTLSHITVRELREKYRKKADMFLFLRRNHTYVNSLRMADNRRIPNIHNIFERSHINRRVIGELTFYIWYSPIFVFSKYLEVPRMYSVHNDEYWEYTNTLIHTLLIHLFSPNVRGYSLRINICAVPPLY